MTESRELERWKADWQEQGPPGPEITTHLARARRDALLMLVVAWGIVLAVAAVGVKLSLRLQHYGSWVFFALLTAWLGVLVYRFTRREAADRRSVESDVARCMEEMRGRLRRELVPGRRFWSLNLLLGAAMIWLPWELWREGVFQFAEPWQLAVGIALFNGSAVAAVVAQVRERRRNQRLFDSLNKLSSELREP